MYFLYFIFVCFIETTHSLWLGFVVYWSLYPEGNHSVWHIAKNWLCTVEEKKNSYCMCRLIDPSISPNKFVTYLISPFLLIHLKIIDLTKYSQKHTTDRNSPDINTNKVSKFCELASRFVIGDWGRGRRGDRCGDKWWWKNT